MTGLPDLIGLLYRADWTRLSLSAELRFETGRELLPRPPRENWSRGSLLIGPGGRWRLTGTVSGQGTEGEAAGGEAAEGNDGERSWSWRSTGMGSPPPLPVVVDGAHPPVPELFFPSGLLGGYTLEELGPVTVAGRDAIAVAATPRRDVLGSEPGRQAPDRIEVAVDAELGILLRRTETSGGELVTRTELTAVTMNPPEAADSARFAAPLGSHRGETVAEGLREMFGVPGLSAAKNAADRAAGGLGALIRNVPHLPGHGAAAEQPETMPSPDPAPLGPSDGSPPPDEVLDLLYRSGDPHDLGATVRQWHDLVVMAGWAPERIRTAGRGGFADLLDAMTRGLKVARKDTRLRVSGPDRYRLDLSRPDRRAPKTIACDGDRRWRVYQDRILVGPAAPLADHIVFLADACWLLRGRLSGGQEITYRGRPAYQLRVTRAPGAENLVLGPLMFFPADAIVDAETGGLLRLLSYSGDALAIWSELDDISTEPVDPDEFRPHLPPGTRVVEQTGNLWTDAAAGMPGLKGTAARAAAETINRTTSAVSAARTFLDDLRGNPRPPS
jgi:outer membrane lipoprotein-sorting protein